MGTIKYVTEDGHQFTDLELAREHDQLIPLIEKVTNLICEEYFKDICSPTYHTIKAFATELVETDLAAVVNNMILQDYKESEAKRKQVAQDWLASLKRPPEGDIK